MPGKAVRPLDALGHFGHRTRVVLFRLADGRRQAERQEYRSGSASLLVSSDLPYAVWSREASGTS
jgi:hypothetical protein